MFSPTLKFLFFPSKTFLSEGELMLELQVHPNSDPIFKEVAEIGSKVMQRMLVPSYVHRDI